MRVLVACEFSGVVRDAFRERGHDAVSCDLLPSERSGPHIQGDITAVLRDGWDLLIAHPPCTYLCHAGVRHLHSIHGRRGGLPAVHGGARHEAMSEAARFFVALRDAPIPRRCIENPRPHRYAVELIGLYTDTVQPYYFGDSESKPTCLWLRNLPPLMSSALVVPGRWLAQNLPPSAERWKARSRTFPGLAAAMADQWGALLSEPGTN